MSHSFRHDRCPFVFCSVVALVTLLCAAGPALAASKANKQAKENSARLACLNGDYTEGVAILSKLFVESKDPTYIFNQGRCFEQNRRYEDAIARFQEYLRAGRKELSADDRDDAEHHIASCKEMRAQEPGRAPTILQPQPVVASPPTVPSKPEPELTPVPVVSRPAPEPASISSGRGLRIGGIVVASFGVVAAGAGVLFNVKANSMVSDMYTTYDGYSKESDRKTDATLTWVGYGVGAACVVTGAILYAVGLNARSKFTDSVALVPTVGTDGAGAALTGAF